MASKSLLFFAIFVTVSMIFTLLTSPEVKSLIRKKRIKLTSYQELAGQAKASFFIHPRLFPPPSEGGGDSIRKFK